jgi:GAF domain-containing protein/HAMP domain-containing protein
VGSFILLLAFANLGVVLVFHTDNLQTLRTAHILLAALLPAIFPAILTASLVVLRGEWFIGRRRWLLYALLSVLSVSIVMTAFDLLFNTNLYFTGFKPSQFSGSMIPLQNLATGPLGWPVILINLYIMPIFTLLPLSYFAFVDRGIPRQRRNLARLLLLVQMLAILALYFLPNVILSGIEILVVTSFYIVLYAYLAFAQLISERRSQTGRLQPRLTALVLVVTLPTFFVLALSINELTQQSLAENAGFRLEQSANATASTLRQWLDLNYRVLQTLALQPIVQNMDAENQPDLFKSMQENFSYMSSISTTNAFGETVARSDGGEPTNYHNELWFQNALRGVPISLQTQTNPRTGFPELVVSTAIRNQEGAITGTVLFTTPLESLNQQIASQTIGATGFVYVVDERGYLVSHPGLSSGEVNVNEFAFVTPVDFARRQGSGIVNYTDQSGESWLAYSLPLENNWVIVAQQQESEVLQTARAARNFAFSMIGVSSLVILLLTWATMRQAFEPFKSLTGTAQAIARGDLRRVAPIESEDEFGTLARSFNSMTAQLVELIDNLERRVQERTQDLERRTAQLKAATEVGRAVAMLHDLDRLLSIVTRLISESFGFYHVGIFLLDEKSEYAVLRAANSAGGQKMLARGHRLLVGEQGIVGYCTQRREPRIALNVRDDSNHYVNPDLPETRSEMALPLIVGGKLLGALDVQSKEQNAFSQQDLETLQVLADQVAIAISNANLVVQTRQLLEAERRAYRNITRMNWQDFIHSEPVLGYLRDRDGLVPLDLPAGFTTHSTDLERDLDGSDPQILLTPIKVRGETIGVLRSRKPDDAGTWTTKEIDTLANLCDQIGITLESARLFEETQIKAETERLLGEITGHIRETLDVDYVLKTAAQDLVKTLDLSEVEIRLEAQRQRRV